MYVTALLIAGGALLTLGDVIFKYWAGHGVSYLYGLGLALYLAGLLALVESYKYADIQVASALLVLFNIVILTFVGWLYFKETIGALQVAGLIAAGIAIVFLEIGA